MIRHSVWTLLLLAPLSLAAAPLDAPHSRWGRIFLTPEARAALDQNASGTSTDNPQAAPSGRIDGVMQRSAGRTVVWRAGVPQFLDATPTPTPEVRP